MEKFFVQLSREENNLVVMTSKPWAMYSTTFYPEAPYLGKVSKSKMVEKDMWS